MPNAAIFAFDPIRLIVMWSLTVVVPPDSVRVRSLTCSMVEVSSWPSVHERASHTNRRGGSTIVKVPDIGQRVPWYLPMPSPASVTTWIEPPTRGSTLHSGTRVFSGPHHWRSWSSSVHACQTASIGAGEVRSISSTFVFLNSWVLTGGSPRRVVRSVVRRVRSGGVRSGGVRSSARRSGSARSGSRAADQLGDAVLGRAVQAREEPGRPDELVARPLLRGEVRVLGEAERDVPVV